jgi:hypothetical protein
MLSRRAVASREPGSLSDRRDFTVLVSPSVRSDWQEQVFDRLTDDWSEQQRLGFCRAMISLIERSHALNA